MARHRATTEPLPPHPDQLLAELAAAPLHRPAVEAIQALTPIWDSRQDGAWSPRRPPVPRLRSNGDQ